MSLIPRSRYLGIRKGECLALLGPNGAGKSTLISILTGLFTPTKGTALIEGHDIKTEMESIHKMIGICPQFSLLWDQLTCREHLLFFARLKGVPPESVDTFVLTALEKVGLALAADRLASNLSGGMKRRLSIAMALVGDPLFLVMDEPTTGLDPETREELWRTLLKVKKGRAILLATHAMEEADLLCERVSILSRGDLKCLDGPLQLRQRFCPDYSLSVNFAPGFGAAAVLGAMQGVEVMSEFENAARLKVATNAVKLSELFRTMEYGIEQGYWTDWGVEKESLENVFLSVVEDDIISV